MANRDRLVRSAADLRHRRPIRLLWLIDSLTVGGAEALVVPFARRAAAERIELTVCARTTIGGNPLENDVRATGVEVVNLEATTLRDRAAFRRLMRTIGERKIDLIHAHLAYASIWGALAARRARIPLVASLHVAPAADAGLKERARRQILVWLLNRHAERIVFVSAALAAEWRKSSSLRAGKLSVVHNGIDVNPPASVGGEDVRSELGLAVGAPLVMTVSVLRAGKGIDVLLRAAARILEESPSCRFAIVGDGPMRETWQKLAGELGVAEAIVWTGYRRDVSRLLAAADLFVLPTLRDAFPTVLLEAMAAGKPIVASDVGGVPEIVDDATGRLVPPADEGALARAILEALRDRHWRDRAGAAAASRLLERFSIDAWLSRLRAMYDEVLEARA
ncbi:MAG TPA: glycosyltransferase [Candidatus Limnocylindria bacterium]|nr:glycosyltransferase [Candidatus Limnocylindria bacterium]